MLWVEGLQHARHSTKSMSVIISFHPQKSFQKQVTISISVYRFFKNMGTGKGNNWPQVIDSQQIITQITDYHIGNRQQIITQVINYHIGNRLSHWQQSLLLLLGYGVGKGRVRQTGRLGKGFQREKQNKDATRHRLTPPA